MTEVQDKGCIYRSRRRSRRFKWLYGGAGDWRCAHKLRQENMSWRRMPEQKLYSETMKGVRDWRCILQPGGGYRNCTLELDTRAVTYRIGWNYHGYNRARLKFCTVKIMHAFGTWKFWVFWQNLTNLSTRLANFWSDWLIWGRDVHQYEQEGPKLN